MTAPELWLLIAGMGLITFGLRAGSLLLGERLPMTPALRSFLRFVPVAVLSAMIALELFFVDGALNPSPLANPRLLGGLIAVVIAWQTRRMIPTILLGMAAFWILQAILK